jgi:demethylspheroidene O-methyltransferase
MSLRDRWRNWRNARIADPKFQRWAARFPMTRPIARANTRAAFDLVAGFVYSQILAACIGFRVFERLAEGTQSVDFIAEKAGLPRDAAERLLKGAAALKLIEPAGEGRFALAQLGAAIGSNPGIVAMIEHHAMLYDDLRDPVALLRGAVETRLKRFWDYAGEREAGPYSELMAASQQFIAGEVLDAYSFAPHKRLLDIGGGHGAFARAAAVRHPNLDVTVFDLPSVAAGAAPRLADLGARARAVGGDFLETPLPEADVVTLVRVLHDHDDPVVARLLARIRAALKPGAKLVIGEPLAGTKGAEPMGDAYFGFYLLAMGSGRPRTAAEYGRMLRVAGFVQVREVRTATPLLVRILVATA